MATNTENPLIVAEAIYSRIVDNQVLLGLDDVFFGDQDHIPRGTTICVVPGPTDCEVDGNNLRAQNNFEVYLHVYVARLADIQETDRKAMEIAQAVKPIFHADLQLKDSALDPEGLVYFGYITRIEPGYTIRAGTMFRAARVTWSGRSRTRLL